MAGFDHQIVACNWMLVRLQNSDCLHQRVVAVRMGPRIRAAIIEIGKQDSLVIIGDESTLLSRQRVELYMKLGNFHT